MAAAAEELSQNIRDQFLQCKICLDGLKEPKTLPCLHTFCAECIICYADHNIIDGRKFACPICRRNIYIPKNGIEGFPDSFFVESLNDVILQTNQVSNQRGNECGICKFKEAQSNAVMLCVDCKIDLCEECSENHTSAKVTEDHTLLPLGSGPNSSLTRDNYCRVHRGETIKYYCETCNTPICLPCTFLDHKGHQVVEIKSIRQNFAEGMTGLVMQSEDNIIQLEQARDDLVELENELFVRKEATKTEVRKTIQDLIRSMNDQESKMLKEIDGFFDTVSVGRDRQKVDRTIFRLQRAHDFAKQLLSSETSPIAQLINRNEATENLNQAMTFELPDITVHATKLDNYMHFLPGNTDISLGSLLPNTGALRSNTVTTIRHTIPSTKAIYMYKLKLGGESHIGDVISLGILPEGDIVVLVSDVKKVKVFNKRGKLRYEFGEDEDLQNPSDMTVTKDGEIAISDCGLRCVKVFNCLGTMSNSFGSDEIFGLPVALTTDATGRYLVCDQAKDRITVHRQSGDLLFDVSIVEMKSPQYIACYNDRVFVCDVDSNMIGIYTYRRDGMELVAKLTTPGSGLGEFLDCSGICCDRSGNLLVADNILDRIHCFNQRAEISHVTTSGRQMMRPACLATSSDNVLAVCQRGVSLDTEIPVTFEIFVYRMIRADI